FLLMSFALCLTNKVRCLNQKVAAVAKMVISTTGAQKLLFAAPAWRLLDQTLRRQPEFPVLYRSNVRKPDARPCPPGFLHGLHRYGRRPYSRMRSCPRQ